MFQFMKTLLIPFLAFAIHSFSQVDSAFSFDDKCYRLWWVDNKMGGYDGFEFHSSGELKLLNYDAFTGEKWWIEEDHLFTEIRSRENGKILRTDYLIKQPSEKSLVLSYTMFEDSYTDKYESILNNNFTDKLLGHWTGENESYIQVVPITALRFQLVISASNKESVEKFEGFLDEENNRIVFYLEREEKEMTIFFEAGKESISISGKTYTRKCE
jgi:hypothetical protein